MGKEQKKNTEDLAIIGLRPPETPSSQVGSAVFVVVCGDIPLLLR